MVQLTLLKRDSIKMSFSGDTSHNSSALSG